MINGNNKISHGSKHDGAFVPSPPGIHNGEWHPPLLSAIASTDTRRQFIQKNFKVEYLCTRGKPTLTVRPLTDTAFQKFMLLVRVITALMLTAAARRAVSVEFAVEKEKDESNPGSHFMPVRNFLCGLQAGGDL